VHIETNLPEQLSDLTRLADRFLGPYRVIDVFA
jgi:hypothetical protein